MAVPADLLHAVIDLVLMEIGIHEIGMPVRARHVATRAHDLLAVAPEPAIAPDHFGETADLPGDLVDRHVVLVEAGAVGRFAQAVIVENESVMIAAIAEEIAVEIAEFLERVRRLAAHAADVGDAKAEKIVIEAQRFAHAIRVDAEMTETPDLERLIEENAAHVIFCFGLDRHGFLRGRYGPTSVTPGMTSFSGGRSLLISPIFCSTAINPFSAAVDTVASCAKKPILR
jgi:hypothetical protein